MAIKFQFGNFWGKVSLARLAICPRHSRGRDPRIQSGGWESEVRLSSRGDSMSNIATPAPSLLEQRAIRKITRRLIPFLMLLYLVAFLDRINVGFAALTMNHEIGLRSEEHTSEL